MGGIFIMGQKNPFYADIMAMHSEVTGSCHLVIVKFPNGKTVRFVVDCGLFQEKEFDDYNNFLLFNADKLDFCLVTHNHVDHIGRLPFLVKKGFDKKIYATGTTCELLPLSLADSYKVLKDVAKRNNRRVLYEESHVEKTLSLLSPANYGEIINVMEGIKATFFTNGHLIGAALILVQIKHPGYEDINILFTGDYNNKNVFYDVKALPKWVRKLPLTIVQEATYGDMESTEIKKTFTKNILKCVSNGGTAVVPVFSLGRAQEILYEIKRMQVAGKLDVEIPIYFDGKLAVKYTNMYIDRELGIKEKMKDFLPENLTFVDKGSRPTVLASYEPKIILTTSGMGSYGPAQVYIPEYITRSNALIQFTGYCAEGTLGYKLKNAEIDDIVEVGGTILKKRAKVEYTTEFSAHAKADQMIEFLKKFDEPRLILVNHGETETKKIFAERIVKEVNAKRVGILGKEYFFRVNPYGLVKTLSTKFK